MPNAATDSGGLAFHCEIICPVLLVMRHAAVLNGLALDQGGCSYRLCEAEQVDLEVCD